MQAKVLLGIHEDLGYFLAAMAAVEDLKIKNPDLLIDIAIPNKEQADYAKHAWFTSKIYTTVLGDVPDAAQYEFVHLMTSNEEITKTEELRLRAEAKSDIDEQIEKVAKERDLDPTKIAKPDDYAKLDPEAPPIWNIVCGYCYSLANACGLACMVNPEDPKPWLYTPSKDVSNKYLHTNKETIRPGCPYVVVDNYDFFSNLDTTIIYPKGWEWVEVDEATMSPLLIAALITNQRCKLVIGPTKGAVYMAWTAGKPLLEVVPSKEESLWDITRAKRRTVVTSLAPNFAQQFEEVTRKVFTKECQIHWQD